MSTASTMKFSLVALASALLTALILQDVMRASYLAAAVPVSAAAAAAAAGDAVPADTAAPASTLVDDSVAGTVHVSYCSSCGYAANYQGLKTAVEQHLPGVTVTGATHPVPFLRTLLSYALLALVPCVYMFHEHILALAGVSAERAAPYVEKVKANKFMWAMGAMYVINMIRSGLTNTGAFEVEAGGAVLWSKLATGAFPDPLAIVEKLRLVV